MIFVEPNKCWEDRIVEQHLRAQEEARRRNLARLRPIAAELLHIVENHNEAEIRNTTLAHAFAKIPGYRNRKERDGWIKKAWQHLQSLIIIGKLEWANKRNHVRLAPPEKHKAYLAKLEQRLVNLPKPRV